MRASSLPAVLLLALSVEAAPCVAGAPAADEEDFFAPGAVLSVHITMAPGDWEALRQSSTPYPRFPAEMRIDERKFSQVSVRKKGTAGSLSRDKPALKIYFGDVQPGARPGGLLRLTLNNSHQDPAFIRQCLAYWLYQRAGVLAPRCNFADLAVNDQPYGLYVNVESVDGIFLARRFKSDRMALYEGNDTDLAADWRKNVERKMGQDNTGEPIVRLIKALYLPEGEFQAALERLLDSEEFFHFWALTVIMYNTDSFHSGGSNFYLAFDPGRGKFHFVPWGADEGFGPMSRAAGLYVATPLLVRRLLAISKTRLRFEKTIKKLLDTVWNEKEILARADFLAELIRERVGEEQRKNFLEHIDAVRQFVAARRRVVLEEMERLRPRPARGKLAAERETLYFAPFRPGREETLCTRLLWHGPRPPAAEASLDDQALRARITSRGSRLCVSQIGQPGKEIQFVRVRVPGRKETYSPVRVVVLKGIEEENDPAGR